MKITRKTNLTQRILNAGIAFVLTLSTTSSILPYLVAQTANAVGPVETVYDALPSVVPHTNYDSYGAQAHQFNEFGDRIVLGGTSRQLDTVTVTMTDWAKKSGNTTWCADNASKCNDEGYLEDITLNVRKTDGSIIGTKTQSVSVPWRPESDDSCAATSNGKGWLEDGVCINKSGLAFNVTFDFSASTTILDSEVLLGVAYNTQTQGYAPTGVAGPYNSLNVTFPANQPVSVGADKDVMHAYVASSNPSYWGSASSSFSEFETWPGSGTVAFKVTATHVTYHVNNTLNNFESVLNVAQSGDVIELDTDYTTTKQLTVKTGVTINGNGHTVTGNFTKTGEDNNSVLGVWSDDVTVNNLTVDAVSSTKMNHGINVFDAQNVALNDVTTKNGRSGINVNRSTVTVSNVTTAGNAWHGIDVDKPGSVLTINGVSHHSDVVPVYIDDTTVGQVIDTNSQYGSKDNVLRAGDRVYSLKPGVPTLLSPANNGYTTTNDFYFDWTNVSGAVEYEFQSSQNPATTGGVLTTGVWNNKANGGPDRNHLTDSKIHSYGASGTWYWQVRAIDANGVAGDWSSVWKMTIDTAAPAAPTNLSWKTSANVTVANNGTTNIYDGAALWQASASSDVDHYVYKYWNDITGNQYKVGSEYVTTTSATSLPGVFNQGDGVHHFCIASVDRAGNTSACTAFAITYDATAPTAPTITSPTTGDEFASSVDKIRANWTASTDTSGIAKYQIEYVYTRNGSETTDYRDVAANRLYRDQSLSGSVLSDFTIRVRAQDKAGNWSDWSDPVTYYYGVPAPTNETEEPGGTGTNPPETNQGGSTQNQGTGTPAPASSPAQQLFALQPAATPAQILAAAADGNTDVLGVTDNESTPTVKGASDQAKTLASTANPEGVLGASDNKLFGLVWYWWLLIVAAVVAAGWWIIAAARRRRDGDDA